MSETRNYSTTAVIRQLYMNNLAHVFYD